MKKNSFCRFCNAPLQVTFCDLGMSPFANAFLTSEKLSSMEPFYPLHAKVCTECFLVQVDEYESPEAIFGDYAYFSSYSESWLNHAKRYAEAVVERFKINSSWQIIEIASNDGYLLQYFKQMNVKVLGVEPAANVAAVAIKKGIPTRSFFFGDDTANALVNEGIMADLLIGNNVLAHVPDLKGFVSGISKILKPDGVVTMEFPHLLALIEENQFDTIYHEHFSYLSLITVSEIFRCLGLRIFDVEQLPTHGGSLRIFACHQNALHETKATVEAILNKENESELRKISTYKTFSSKVENTKLSLLEFVIAAKRADKVIVAYGAAAKGNTLLNFCGIRSDLIDYAVDLSHYKQGLYMPGTHIPIYSPERIEQTKPDYVLILPWNLKNEISMQMKIIRNWGGQFVVPIPNLEVF